MKYLWRTYYYFKGTPIKQWDKSQYLKYWSRTNGIRIAK